MVWQNLFFYFQRVPPVHGGHGADPDSLHHGAAGLHRLPQDCRLQQVQNQVPRRAGHATTTLPRQRDNGTMFAGEKSVDCGFMSNFVMPLHLDTEALTYFVFFLVSQALIK